MNKYLIDLHLVGFDCFSTIKCLCLGTIGLIVAPWKFDVLKTSIFALRTSNFGGATISP